MRVQHNIASMNSYRNYNVNTRAINKNLEKLSSGYKINRAGDDAAGLAISEKMRAQITGLEGAQKNAKDGISLVQTAEGALTEVHSMLNRMYQLAEQSANGTYENTTDRTQLQKEISKLSEEIDRISDSTNFNGIKLLDGSLGDREFTVKNATANGIRGVTATGGDGKAMSEKLDVSVAASGKVTVAFNGTAPAGITWKAVGSDTATPNQNGDSYITFQAVVDKKTALADKASLYDGMTVTVQLDRANSQSKYAADSQTVQLGTSNGLKLQIGDTADDFNQMTVAVKDIGSDALGINGVDISTQGGAQSAMAALKTAINTVSDVRGGLGATQNRLEHTISNLSVMQENIQDAESTIRDTDVADEMMKYTKNSILVQSAQAMLAQANQQPQGVLQLLQ
jgi:flagellin